MAKPGSTYVDSATLDELEHDKHFSFRVCAAPGTWIRPASSMVGVESES